MCKATRAILKHYTSPPDHSDCPEGETSWCLKQRDKVTGLNQHKDIKNPLPPAIVNLIQPTFDFLGSKELLSGCVNCFTQNTNESFHHVLWGILLKQHFHSYFDMVLGFNYAVIQFNMGIESAISLVLDNEPSFPSSVNLKSLQSIDRKRKYFCDRSKREDIKQRRKDIRKKVLKKLDAFQHAEGSTYASDKF